MIDIAIGFGIICSSDESELDPLLPLFYAFSSLLVYFYGAALAQSLSALYPAGTDEKRWIDGLLARKKGLGF